MSAPNVPDEDKDENCREASNEKCRKCHCFPTGGRREKWGKSSRCSDAPEGNLEVRSESFLHSP